MSPSTDSEKSDWIEYKRLVLAALEQSAAQNVILNKRIGEIEIALAKLNVQSAIWGSIGGVIFSAIVALLLRRF
jgi:hypothetical protein